MGSAAAPFCQSLAYGIFFRSLNTRIRPSRVAVCLALRGRTHGSLLRDVLFGRGWTVARVLNELAFVVFPILVVPFRSLCLSALVHSPRKQRRNSRNRHTGGRPSGWWGSRRQSKTSRMRIVRCRSSLIQASAGASERQCGCVRCTFTFRSNVRGHTSDLLHTR